MIARITQQRAVAALYRSGSSRAFATTADSKSNPDKKESVVGKIPQPPKEQVQHMVESRKQYKDELHKIRSQLVKDGVLNQSFEKQREEKIKAGKVKVGRTYTPEQKAKKKEEAQRRDAENVARIKAEASKEKENRIKRNLIRRKVREMKEEEELKQVQYELALDIEATWNKSVKDDLSLIVPVNAPFLGVLPKRHAPAAQSFADDIYKLRFMYGPPKAVTPADNAYGGYDPRVAVYTEFRFAARKDVNSK